MNEEFKVFDKALFSLGEYVTYEGRFVARFKYHNARSERARFLKFLRNNFTVAEYFTRLEAGEHPLPILESKGYVSYNVAKALTAAGYPVTQEGKRQYLNDEIAARAARVQGV